MKKSAILISIIIGVAVICSAVIFSFSINYDSEKAEAEVSTIDLNVEYDMIPTQQTIYNGSTSFSNIPFSSTLATFTIKRKNSSTIYSQTVNAFRYTYNTSTNYSIEFGSNNFQNPYRTIMIYYTPSDGVSISYSLYSGSWTTYFNTSINNIEYIHVNFQNLNTSSTNSSIISFWNTFKNGNLKLMLNNLNFSITWNITDGTGAPTELTPNTETTLQITPNIGYGYPTSVSYVGSASDIQYYDETGEIVITNPTSNFTIEGVCFSYYDQGYQSGYDVGYNEGFVAGEDAMINNNIISNNVTGVVSAIFSGLFGNIFAVEIFPNFPLYLFILIPTVFAVIGLLLWLIRGK